MKVWHDDLYLLAANDMADVWALIEETPELSALYQPPVIPSGTQVDAMLRVLWALTSQLPERGRLHELLTDYVEGRKTWPPAMPWGRSLEGQQYIHFTNAQGERVTVSLEKVLQRVVRGIVADHLSGHWERRQ